MCDCRFCQTPPQSILQCLCCPLSLIGQSNLDKRTKNILLFGDPTKSIVFANGVEYSSLLEACKKMSISLDSLFMKDFTLGIVRFDTLKDVTWQSQAPSQADKEQTIRDCTAAHKVDNASVMLNLLPQMGKRLRVPEANQTNTRQRSQDLFDPFCTPSHMWTSEKLLAYIRQCPRSNREGFPRILAIIDDYDSLHKRSLNCTFADVEGKTVDLWLPQGIVYFTPQYYTIWQEFEKEKKAIDTSWDEWSP